MNWVLIAILSCCGLIMGLLAVNGYTHKIEPVLWLVFAVAATLVISRNAGARPFMHGLYTGLAWGILNGLCQAAFFDAYIAANPAVKENFDKVTFMPARLFPLLTGPVIGLLAGVVLGGLSLAARKIAG